MKIIFNSCSIPFIILTILSLMIRSTLYLFSEMDIDVSHDFRGYFSDIFVVSLCYAIVILSKRFYIYIYSFIFIVLAIINIANMEHILAMNTSISLRALHFLGDADALRGAASISTISTVLLCIHGIVITGIIGYIHIKKIKQTVSLRNILLIVLSTAFILNIWPASPNHSSWRQTHAIAENTTRELSYLIHKKTNVEKSKQASSLVQKMNQTDLDGERRYVGNKKNVLLILIEGASGHHVFHPNQDNIWQDNTFMPKLAKSGESGIRYTHFWAPQVQTNRGEYALLCGDLPNLVSGASKMVIAKSIMEAKQQLCLPKHLKNNGYNTSYIQAAGMNFMSKDTFMPEAGFDQVHGNEWFKKPYFKHPWGVGDYDFFKQSHREIDRLNKAEKPWFATMLTVGTHHSYAMPEKFIRPELSPYANAIAHADDQVMAFIEELDRQGILDNTLVIVSSDESQGTPKDASHITKNWVPFVVFDKGSPTQDISESFNQADFSLSILDYLNLTDRIENLPPGRSIFRHYTNNRPIFFARYYDNATYWLNTKNSLIKCDLEYYKCTGYNYATKHVLWQPNDFINKNISPEKIDMMRYVSQQNDWDFERFISKKPEYSSKTPWLASYYMKANFEGKQLDIGQRKIYFNWSNKAPFPGFTRYKFSAKWQTCLHTESTEDIFIELMADEGSKLFIDDKLIIDGWKNNVGKTLKKEVTLKPGTHRINVHYYAHYWSSKIKLNLYKIQGKEKQKLNRNHLYMPTEMTRKGCRK